MSLSPLYIIGINHHTAPIAIREKCAFRIEEYPEALTECKRRLPVTECFILSTCNRTEIVAISPTAPDLMSWWAHYHDLHPQTHQAQCYQYQGQAALEHLLAVACGLNSMLIGEPEILGQLKSAYQHARAHGAIGPILSRLMPRLFGAAKAIRSDTQVGSGPISLSYTAIAIAKQQLPLETIRPLFIGSGDVITRCLSHVHAPKFAPPIIANRSLEKAQQLARAHSGRTIAFKDIPTALASVDLVICATRSILPLIGKGMMEAIVQQNPLHKRLLLDLACPRDIEPQVRDLEGVTLLDLDDLNAIISQNWQQRQLTAEHAQELIASHAQTLEQDLAIAAHGHHIRAFRNHIQQLKTQHFADLCKHLPDDPKMSAQIERSLQRLINDILHHPTKQLRQAIKERDHQMIALASQWYRCDDPSSAQDS